MLGCCPSPRLDQGFWWLMVVILSGVLLFGLYDLSQVVKPGHMPKHVRREYSVAMAAGCVYMLLSTVPRSTALWSKLPANLQDAYNWMPFWYAFLVSKFTGNVIEVARDSVVGVVIACAFMCIMNYAMPGGAAPQAELGWVPGGYQPSLMWVFSAIFVFSMHNSGLSISTKQYALGFFSSTVVSFMDPHHPPEHFEAVLWNYDFEWNVTGYVLCNVWVVFLSVPFAVFTIPSSLFPFSSGLRRFFSSYVQGQTRLQKIAFDTTGTLSRLLTYFAQDSGNFDIESTRLYIAQLGMRRKEVEALLEGAWWECITPMSRKRLQELWKIATLLQSFRQLLRVQLDVLREAGPSFTRSRGANISPLLAEFQEEVQKVFIGLFAAATAVEEGGAISPQRIRHCATCADNALRTALVRLRSAATTADNKCAGQGAAVLQDSGEANLNVEKAFINGLRTTSSLLRAFADELELGREAQGGQWPRLRSPTPSAWPRAVLSYATSREKWAGRVSPIRCTVTWLIALSWSCYRGYSSTCASAVSFLFSPSLGKLFDRNVNRILGVGLGLVLGGLPQILLMNPDARCGRRLCFKAEPQGSILYFELMFLLFTASIYGMIASGGKSTYACCLWAGFGGTMMLSALTLSTEKTQTTTRDTEASLYNQTMDNVLACLLVFIVDSVVSLLLRRRPPEYAGILVFQSYDAVAELVQSLGDCDYGRAKQHLEVLKERVDKARDADAEVHRADLVWSSVHMAPYKADMVSALLERLDNIYVTSWSILASVEGLGNVSSQYQTIVNRMLPSDQTADECRLYASVIGAALLERRGAKIEDLVAQGKLPQAPSSQISMDHWTDLARAQDQGARADDGLDPDDAPGGVNEATLRMSKTAASLATLRMSKTAMFRPSKTAASLASLAGLEPVDGSLVELEKLRDQVVAEDLSDLDATKEAGIISLAFDYWSLCLNILKVRALLQEHAYWASAEWRPTEEELIAAQEEQDVTDLETIVECEEDETACDEGSQLRSRLGTCAALTADTGEEVSTVCSL